MSSNRLSALRAALSDALDLTDVTVLDHVPERISPPCVFVGPGEPYLSRDATAFGGLLVRAQLVPVVAAATNEVAAEALDALILAVFAADVTPWHISQVGRPGPIQLNGQTYLGVVIDAAIETSPEALA